MKLWPSAMLSTAILVGSAVLSTSNGPAEDKRSKPEGPRRIVLITNGAIARAPEKFHDVDTWEVTVPENNTRELPRLLGIENNIAQVDSKAPVTKRILPPTIAIRTKGSFVRSDSATEIVLEVIGRREFALRFPDMVAKYPELRDSARVCHKVELIINSEAKFYCEGGCADGGTCARVDEPCPDCICKQVAAQR
jgi:hypothetical protein